MIKKLILMIMALFILLSFMCSCNKTEVETEETTALKTVKDNTGKTYSAIIGSDGFLLLGDRGQLAITVDDGKGKPGKNADGEFVTRTEEFPNTLVVDNEIHAKFMKMPIPENWTNKSYELIEFTYKDDNGEATFYVNERHRITVEECQKEIEGTLRVFQEITKENVKLAFGDAVKIVGKHKLLPREEFYIFNVEGRTYFVGIIADESLFETIDFEEIINTMKFRKGE